MATLILSLMGASFGLGASATWIVKMIRNRDAVPAWAKITDAAGKFGGER